MTSDANNGAERRGLPVWAKVLIGLVIVGIIGFVTIFVGAVVFFQNTFKQAQDPAAISQVASHVAAFPNPLPQGYRFVMGLNLAGIDTLTVEHKPDNQLIFVIAYPKAEKDPQEVVQRISETGVNAGQTSAKFEKVKSKGSDTVAGQPMPYIVGTLIDKSGSHEGMFGCIVPKGKDKTILIYAAEPTGTPYNFSVTKNFLDSIQGFN